KTGMIWFNIRNSHVATAAAPQLKVTISDPVNPGATPKAIFLSERQKNPGFVSTTEAFVRYSKVSGTGIRAVLSPSTVPDASTSTGIVNDTFGAVCGPGGPVDANDPCTSGVPYGVDVENALYVRIPAGAQPGDRVLFTVEVDVANASPTKPVL